MASKKKTYYKTIAGVKYDKELLEQCEKAAADGQVSVKEAQDLWKSALDGIGVTKTEEKTLRYCLEKFKFTDKAAEFLKGKLTEKQKATGATGYYKQINGVKYDRELLEQAEAFVKDGQISEAEAKELWELALDGSGVTATERRTLEYVLKEMKCTKPAAEFLKKELGSSKERAEPEPAKEEAEKPKEPEKPTEPEKKVESKTEKPKEPEKKEESKTEEPKEPETPEEPEEPKEPEKPKELEEDAPPESRKKVASFGLSGSDKTLNVMQVKDSSVLMSLGEGGMQYLLAGVRASSGIKSGRYMFEVRILEQLNPSEPQGGNKPSKKQQVKVGFSLEGSSLFLDSDESCSFDSEGFFMAGKKKAKASQSFSRETIAVLLNVDSKSPNANTVSLFKNGKRISEPQAIPESLQGKALFPTLTYRNVTLDVNFGPVPRCPLPFSCRMMGDAAADDVAASKLKEPKGGKYEVVFPIGLPDTGYFEYIDSFLEKNPSYTELSDRKIIDWAAKSGLAKPKNSASNDKPSMNFGIPLMDDGSVRKVLSTFAQMSKRNLVIAELKSNLVADDRKKAVSSFSAPQFKKKAVVLMGEPDKDYIAMVQSKLLAAKKVQAEADHKRKIADAQRKRLLEEKKKKAEEAKKARLAAAAKKAGKDEPEEESKEEDKPEETAMDVEETPPAVELTEDEKKTKFIKSSLPDIAEKIFAKAYTSFSIPTSDEGFDEVSFGWGKESECSGLLKKFILEQKLLQKVEDLQPSDWFKEKSSSWQKSLSEWKKKQTEWKDPKKKKELLEKKRESLKKEGEETAPELPKIEVEDLDVNTVEDVSDVGNGEPLFANFVFEDWTLLATRYEFHLLLHAFKRDLDDPDRPTFSESHLPFYYQKYYKKPFNVSSFGCKTLREFSLLIKDTLKINAESHMLEALLSEDEPITKFVKLAEDHRRDRERRSDAGDETAMLKFSRTPQQPSGPGPTGPKPAAPVGQKRPYAGGPQATPQPAWKQARPTYTPIPAFRR